MKILFKSLEDPNRPLLGPNVKSLKFWGLLLPNKIYMRYFYYLMHFVVSVFTATEYVDIWFIKTDLNLVLNNLKITMLATVSVVKVTTFLLWQKKWRSIIEYVTAADINQRKTDDPINKRIIRKFTKYSRSITYLYWSLMYTTVIIVMVQPLVKYFASASYRENVRNGTETYLQVVSSWVPFDKNTIPGYLAASVLQTYAAVYGGGWITSFDTNAIVIMVFFKGELDLLRRDCANIFGSENSPADDLTALKRLRECHQRHVNILKYSRLFDSCLSPIMLLYMFVCSVMLCASAYQITIETNPMQRLLTTEYLVFGVAQLFMYCWHGNDVLYSSQSLAYGPYESAWWTRGVESRKKVLLLLSQFQKTVVFTAGPFANLNVPTFVNILKGAYSYYTLLNQSI